MPEGFSTSVGPVSNGVEGDAAMWTTRAIVIMSVGLLATAFITKINNMPGVALAAAGHFALDRGWVELEGPVGDAVLDAIGEAPKEG